MNAQALPHRPPFVLVDRLVSVDGNSARAIRNITSNDPLVGDTLPAVLLIEAMAQTAALLATTLLGPHRGSLVAIRDLRCEAAARVGDCVMLTATQSGAFGALSRVHAEAAVDGRVIARGELTFAVEAP